MYRNTYAKINLNNINNDIQKIINYYPDYDYYFDVVKADNTFHLGDDVLIFKDINNINEIAKHLYIL